LYNQYKPRGFGGFSMFPKVIKNLLIINAIVWFIQIIFANGIQGGTAVLDKWFALNPINLFGYSGWPFNFQIWQLITYQFMHSPTDFTHIFFNMLMLWMFGMEIENIWGAKKFLTYYLLCGVSAGVFQLFLPQLFGVETGRTLGASGAVFGVMIAFAMIFPDRYIFLWFLIPIKAKYLIGFLFFLELFLIGDAGSNIAHLAHLGGAIAGFIYIMLDKNTFVSLKSTFRNLSNSGKGFNSSSNPFSNIGTKFKKRESNVEEANFYDINDKNRDEEVTQEDIDRILDKISQSGYQNLTEKEKKVLFEASKKMK
jgi:rhomboid family protein